MSVRLFVMILVLLLVFPVLGISDTITKVFNYPNPYIPASGDNNIVFFYVRSAGAGDFTLTYYVTIYNLVGHRVLVKQRTFPVVEAAVPNVISFTWNGKTDRGDAVPPGVYYIRIVTDGGAGSVQSISKYGKMMIK